MWEWLSQPEAWIALATLTSLEIVLGIDNIIFISILVARLPAHQQDVARRLGLGLAMGTRLLLLFSISWIMGLTADLFTVLNQGISGRDLILGVGGLFLIWKASTEIYHSTEGGQEDPTKVAATGFMAILVQIAILDIIFSLDSVISAVGLVDELAIMMLAVIISVGVMMFAAKPIGEFVEKHPSVKMLALSFLVVVGVVLIGESLDQHLPKGYIYFAMAFAFTVEMLNIRSRKKTAQAAQGEATETEADSVSANS